MARHPRSDMGELDNPEVTEIVWEVFASLARKREAADASHSFLLDGNSRNRDSVTEAAFELCKSAGVLPAKVGDARYPPFRHVVLKVYHSALSIGLVLPGQADQEFDQAARWGRFHFTSAGLRYFLDGRTSIDVPGHLGQVLNDLTHRLTSISEGQVALLLEAQRCVASGCYRAGMVVIGVACEDSCIGLLRAIAHNCVPPSDSHLKSLWGNCKAETQAFASRWKASLEILRAVKRTLQPSMRSAPWRHVWEGVPDSLRTLGEAVRVSRNAAAHDGSRLFTKNEVALLLAAMPNQLELVAELTDFFVSPPSGVVLQT